MEPADDLRKNKDWTDNVRQSIWKTQPLPCTFTFPNSYFKQNIFKFNGLCSDCQTSIRGESDSIKDSFVKIKISTYCTPLIPHK